jgi:hypothetical protein
LWPFFTLAFLVATSGFGAAIFILSAGDGGSDGAKSESSLKVSTFFLFRRVETEAIGENVENIEATELGHSRRSRI